MREVKKKKLDHKKCALIDLVMVWTYNASMFEIMECLLKVCVSSINDFCQFNYCLIENVVLLFLRPECL